MKDNKAVFNSNNNVGLPRARARYLTQAIALEEDGPSGIIKKTIFLSALLLVSLLYWSSLTYIDEVSVATGEILPDGLIHNIQHLEGGIVESITIRNGDRVVQGEILITLTPPATTSDFNKMKVRKLTLELQIERLKALIADRAPEFPELNESQTLLSIQQLIIHQSERQAHINEIRSIDQQISSKRDELTRNKNQVSSLRKEVNLLKEQVQIRRGLNKKGLVSKTELLSTQSKLLESMSKLRGLRDGSAFAASEIKEKTKLKDEARSNFIRDKQLETGQLLNQLAEINEELIRLKDKVDRLQITSPVNGFIQALNVTSINEVIDAGEVIMRIVPVDDELIVEAELSPSDIGYIQIGQAAEIKVDSYDAGRFGSVDGKVVRISATTYLNDDKQPYYRTEIKLAKPYVGDDPKKNILIPGMTVQTNIKIGSKSLLEYLMKPITRGLDNAFHEK